jgi:NitT/TauT family transport system substrate-binding protein
MVLRSFAAKKPATVQKFVNAVQRAILWSQSAPVDELIKVLHGYEAFVRYDQRIFGGSIRKMMPAALPKSVVITPEAFENATKLSIAADAMKEPMPMARLVDNRFAEAAAKNVKPDTR